MSFSDLSRRLRRYRTPVLALIATLLLVWSTVVIFDVPISEVLGFLLVCVLGVACIVALAFVFSWCLQKLRS